MQINGFLMIEVIQKV